MASDSFARGGQPRSVPDHDGDAYDEMIRRHRALAAQREISSSARSRANGAPTPHTAIDSAVARVAHVLNEARVARHELEQGHRVRAAVDAVTAGLDLGWGALFLKDGFKLNGPHDWKTTRKWMGDQGILAKKQHGHHGLIPQRGWGKRVPDVIKNQPPNIRPMESPVAHTRIQSAAPKAGLPRFTPVERYLHGTPRWWKGANAAAVGHSVQVAGDHLPGHSPHRGAQRR